MMIGKIKDFQTTDDTAMFQPDLDLRLAWANLHYIEGPDRAETSQYAR